MKNLHKKSAKNEDITISTEAIEGHDTIRDLKNGVDNTPKTGSFSKIEIHNSMNKSSKKRYRKFFLGIVSALIIFIIFFIFFGLLPGRKAYIQMKNLVSISKELGRELKAQNLEGAKLAIPKVKDQLTFTKSAWNKVLFLKFMPILSAYHQDGTHALNAAGFTIDAIETATNTVEPYADLLGLKAGSSFVSGSADERIQLAVKTMDKMTPKLADIGVSIEKLRNEVDKIDPQRYPEKIRGLIIRENLVNGKKILNETSDLFLNAKPLLEVLPQILGEPQAKRYFVIFQNDAELRPTGGFITAYAIFRVENGRFIVEKSDDIYELDEQIKNKKPAPPEILTYHKGVYVFNLRDSNLSPDFLFSMQKLAELYPGKFDFDGIIAVDTKVLVEAIKILGTFVVKGRTFSAEIDKRCDCPKVIYELEDYATRPVAYVREERKDILGELLLQIMKKALGVSPSQYWGQLFQMTVSQINEKHILAFMKDEKAQVGIESLNMGGRIAADSPILGYKDGQNWDYLHINDANMAGAKSNLFIENFVKQDYEAADDGTIIKNITIDYKNPAPPSDCNLESGGLCLNGLLRNWVRIYVPKGSELIESRGSQSPKDESIQNLVTREELGKTVFEGFLTVRPLGSAQLTLKYRLPFKIQKPLNILLQKQPGTSGHEYMILVKGKERDKFKLQNDKILILDI